MPERPNLLVFYSEASGRCRRVDGFLAQVLQRRRNHETFKLFRVAQEEHPELFERFRVDTVPTLVVVDDRRVCGTLVEPRGCRDVERFLGPWLHGSHRTAAEAQHVS
jgi:thioredoxin-like negative regulator of GroEL